LPLLIYDADQRPTSDHWPTPTPKDLIRTLDLRCAAAYVRKQVTLRSVFEGEVVTGLGFQGSRTHLVARAVSGWVDQLTDLSGRNTLLYYKDLARGNAGLIWR